MKEAACRTDLGPLTKKLLEQQQVIERLTAERDRARRTLCQVLVLTRPPGSKQGERGFAKEMGWDCYKQEAP
jgi:hypothetical protein